MGSDRKIVNYEGLVKTIKACEYLEGLLSGLKAGAIYIKKSGGCTVLKPAGKIKINITASDSAEKKKLKITLKWHRDENSLRQDDLLITPTEIVEALGLFIKKKSAAGLIKKRRAKKMK
jgi:amphi-Trp domain-containing protein